MYRHLKDKIKIFQSDKQYTDMFYMWVGKLFQYDKRIFRPDILEYILHTTGRAALIRTDTAEYTPVLCDFVGGDRYADDIFKTVYCYDARAYEYTFEDWRNNRDIIVIFNNPYILPDFWIDKYSEYLTDIDISIKCNVLYSRLKKVPISRDQKTKYMIDAVMQDNLTGKYNTVLADFSFKDLADDKELIEVLELTNVDDSRYIQYLLHAYDSVFSRVMQFMGFGTPDNGKQAQITTDENNRNIYASLINPFMWLESRKEGLEGTGLSVEFSHLMKNRIEKETEVNENENAESIDNSLLSKSDSENDNSNAE